MLKLARRARGHFVTLIEIRVHLIRVRPGHISCSWKFLLCCFLLGCTSYILGEWFGLGAFGVVVAVPAGFAFVSLFICFAKS